MMRALIGVVPGLILLAVYRREVGQALVDLIESRVPLYVLAFIGLASIGFRLGALLADREREGVKRIEADAQAAHEQKRRDEVAEEILAELKKLNNSRQGGI